MALGFMALGFAAARAETPAPPSSRDVHALLDAYKCSICHDERDPRAGPSYAEIAHAYRGRQGGFGHLLSVIKQGEHGGGPWHMPPHPEVSDAEARAMARYILSVPD